MPNIYVVNKPGGPTFFLFGTLHFNIANLQEIPEITDRLASSDYLVLEGDPKSITQELLKNHLREWQEKNGNEFELQSDFIIEAGSLMLRELDIVSDPMARTRCREYLRSISPIYFCNKYIVETFYKNIDMANSLDAQLLHLAQHQNKTVKFFETGEELAKKIVGSSFSFQEQKEYFDFQVFKGFDMLPIMLESMIKNYLENNEKLLKEQAFAKDNTPAVKKYNQDLIDKRDQIMADKIISTHQEEFGKDLKVFVAVGVAHIPGMLDRLESNGFTCTPIPITISAHQINKSLNLT